MLSKPGIEFDKLKTPKKMLMDIRKPKTAEIASIFNPNFNNADILVASLFLRSSVPYLISYCHDWKAVTSEKKSM